MKLSLEEYNSLQSNRDALISRIAKLEARPEIGTFAALAERVCGNMKGLTPDQKSDLNELIINNGGRNIGQ